MVEFALAKEFGWTIEYIHSLPEKKVKELMEMLRAANA